MGNKGFNVVTLPPGTDRKTAEAILAGPLHTGEAFLRPVAPKPVQPHAQYVRTVIRNMIRTK
jgi:hypothetical protein